MIRRIPSQVYIFRGEIERIAGWVQSSPDLEIGGELFGSWTNSGAPRVEIATGPGPMVRRQATAFYQDPQYLEKLGIHLNNRAGLQHIGEWHSHHRIGLAKPSGGDIGTIRKNIANRFLLFIANLDSQLASSMGAFLFHADVESYRELAWILIDGESPIRHELPEKNPSQKSPMNLRGGSMTIQDARSASTSASVGASIAEAPNISSAVERAIRALQHADSNGEFKIKAFEDGMTRIEVTGDKSSLIYLLSRDFPAEAPRILRVSETSQPIEIDWVAEGIRPWSPRTDLSELHRQLCGYMAPPLHASHRLRAPKQHENSLARIIRSSENPRNWTLIAGVVVFGVLLASIFVRLGGFEHRLSALQTEIDNDLDQHQSQLTYLRESLVLEKETMQKSDNRMQAALAELAQDIQNNCEVSSSIRLHVEALEQQLASLFIDVARRGDFVAERLAALLPAVGALPEMFVAFKEHIDGIDLQLTQLHTAIAQVGDDSHQQLNQLCEQSDEINDAVNEIMSNSLEIRSAIEMVSSP